MMTRPSLVALSLAALACLTSVFAGVSAVRSRDRAEVLLARADAVESAGHPKADPGTRAPDNSGLAHDIAALRSEVDSLTKAAAPGATDPAAKAAEDARVQKAWTERMVRAISETLEARLGLSPEQKVQVADVMTAQYAALAGVHRPDASRQDMKEQTARVQADTAEKIRAVLTADQQAGFADMTKGPAGVFGMDLIPNAGRLPGEEGSSGH